MKWDGCVCRYWINFAHLCKRSVKRGHFFLKSKVGHTLGEWFTLLGFLLQCRLRCCPGQKCGHQEAEQTLPEPDPCQEGVPGVGAHEMRQSQKCKWPLKLVGKESFFSFLSLYIFFNSFVTSLGSLPTLTPISCCNVFVLSFRSSVY